MGSGVSGLAQIGGIEKKIVNINEEDSVFVVAFYSVVTNYHYFSEIVIDAPE